MEGLYTAQAEIYNNIKSLERNFKKDGKDRKTADYCYSRLKALESYWSDYQYNHDRIRTEGSRTHPYFVNAEYELVSKLYNSMKTLINQQLRDLQGPPGPVSADLGGSSDSGASGKPPSELRELKSHGSLSRLDEIRRKQVANFKAFDRTVSNMDINILSEKWEFDDALKTLQSRWSIIDSLHWEIVSELDGDDSAYESDFSRYESQFNSLKKAINSKLWSECHRERATPQIEVPLFSGSFNSWVSFKELFEETIHKNRSLCNTQKLQYLKSKLRNEPEKLIQHLHITSENYQVAWDILNNRYNNIKLIFNSHMNILTSLTSMQTQAAGSMKKIHDTTNECLHAIRNLGVDTTNWDPLIVYLVAQKLDFDTHREYVESLKEPRALPSLKDFLGFLEAKFTALESSKRKVEGVKVVHPQQQQPNRQLLSHSYNRKPHHFKSIGNQNTSHKTYNSNHKTYRPSLQKCPVCAKDHGIFNCTIFLDLQSDVKRQTVLKHGLCKNCLYKHEGKDCFSTRTCRVCKEPHNTLLHEAFSKPTTNDVTPSTSNAVKSQSKNSLSVLQKDTQEVLLATAIIKVESADGTNHVMRALIDQGSQTSLITENAAQILGLRRRSCKGIIIGVGATESNCKGVMNICIKSVYNEFSINVDVFIMSRAVNNLPNQTFSKPNWSYIENIQLADPEFYRSRSVDILLGADVYPSILMSGIISSDSAPIAQQTRLGWILCGNVKSYQCNVVTLNIDDMHRFWSIEDISDSNDVMSEEDKQCMIVFKANTTRNADGRYVVRLPLHPDVDEKLGQSRHKALAQFYQIEKKFKKEEKLATDYKSFMSEYINLNHMYLTLHNSSPGYYMPHHCVHRADSATTALRVVFNASQPSSNGLSLNDLMYRGPNLQQDLMSLVTRWRLYKYVITADIEKMFRQVLIHTDDQKYQKILWRDSENQPLKEYELATVTYGTKAAPFLAMAALKQLANDEGHKFPEAAKIVENQFYMDDLLTGGYSIQSTKQLQSDLIELLKLGGFNLRKWTSNNREFIDNISAGPGEDFIFKHKESTKTLGLIWNSKEDIFTFQCNMAKQSDRDGTPTKRKLLGEISKLFDPLGWLAPVVVQLKLLFQNVWIIDLKWDDVIPDDINTTWNKIRLDIENIDKIKIPRWLQCDENEVIQLHGFCDASNKAYACVIYARIQKQNTASVTLLAAKTKLVPPAKSKLSSQDVSLPKLELCGANLLSKLMQKMINSLAQHEVEIYGWCDSTAVLGWLHGEPNRWKPFVANRVKKTIEVMPPHTWRYVKTQENPADCASRGMSVEQLRCHELWWNGPLWLKSFDSQNYKQTVIPTTNLEMKKVKSNVVQTSITIENNIITQLINKHSNFTKLTRVLAWVMRFLTRVRPNQSYLTLKELKLAENKILLNVQQSEFSEDINHIKKHGSVHSNSRLLCLNPFLDNDGLLRVGGRLKLSNIDYDMKHPKIIPQKHILTNLLIDYAHKRTFHGGARLTHSWLRQQYWVLSGNRAVKGRLRQCVLCRRHNPSKHHQIMGNLPESRTNPTRPFYHTGVDYTGHIAVKSNKGRGIKTSKGYVAVFVCMVTKAVHLELVSDLSSSSFLAALRRLAAKRGTPRHMYSDNGTNFVKAQRILSEEYIDLQSIFTNNFFEEVSEMKIDWHFNAPSWPSAGGLWESAVKSLKHHLRRVIGDQKLTYEELHTLLSQLEACLNSRPLCALSEDPDDINYLTPAHFLASGPHLTIYETERDERTRWQMTQKVFNDIWRRWRTEYLVQLSARSKWQKAQPNINKDDVVVIHEDNLPAGRWALGRVVELHPGADGHVRVVSVKTKNGVIKRPIIKLSILPVNSQDNQHEQKTSIPETQNQRNNSNKPKSNFISMLLSIFLIINFLSSAFGSYNITKLNETKGFYFDKVGNMQIIRDDWKVIVYYDMEPYWEGRTALEKYSKDLSHSCENSNNNIQVHCNVILSQLKLGVSELEYYDRMLLNQEFTAYDRRRVRRGLINGVGYIAHSLFGVLDDEFAEQYKRDIDLINSNQKHLALLWKNQTSVIEAEYNLIKRMEDSMSKQHKIVNQRINTLEMRTNTMTSEVQKMETTNDFILSSIITNNLLSKLSKIQESIIDIITNVYDGKFNVHLLTPKQLQDELNIISGQLPKDLSLPINNIQTDLLHIYNLLRVRARMTKTYLIFEIKIPLISREGFEIYNVIPIPQQVGNNSITVTPISDTLAINIQKDTYLPSPDIKTCLNSDSHTYLCYNQGPIYLLKSDASLCLHQNQGTCVKKTTPCKNIWRQLETPNTYLYFCCTVCSVRIICEDQISAQQINKVGIVSLSKGCILKSDSFTIYSHQQLSTTIQSKPEVYVHVIAPINHLINVTIPTQQWASDNDSTEEQSELLKLKGQVDLMKSEAEKNIVADRISYHDIHHYAAIYLVGGAVIVVGVVYACRRGRRARRAALPRPALGAPAASRRVSECASVSGSVSDSVVGVQFKDNSARFVNQASSPVFK